jgi:spermidine/putrescine transport system substrate-binding protein
MTERTFESDPTLAARLERERLSRFELLKKSGITGLVVAGAPAVLGALAETATAARRPAAAPKAPKPTGTLDFFSWEGYDFPNKYVPTMAAWKKKYGLKLKSTYIGNHDDIQAKIKGGGGGGIDLITYYQGYKPLYKELEIITPLDPDKLPNLKNLFPFFASKEKNFWVEPDGTRTGVPMFWGALGINYDTAVYPKAPTTYDILLEPKWKGKVAVVDDPVGVYTLAGHILGYDIGKMTSAQFDKASDWLKALVKQSKGISPSYGDASTRLVSGDAVFAWPGWAAVNEFAAGAGKKTIKTTLPKEGGYSFCDSYAIPPTTDNRDSALAWINEGIDAHVNAEAANYLAGGTTCAASVKYLKKGIAALYDYRKLDKFVARAPFYENPPVESDKYATQAQVQSGWQQVKASA